jgi:GNAT superfamily N-acetyltransferase
MKGLVLSSASDSDAEEIAELRNKVAADVAEKSGSGEPGHRTTAKGVLYHLRQGQILIARYKGRIVGSLLLVKKKPWAIDVSYFTAVRSQLYLVSMNVDPALQRKGIGSQLIEYAKATAKAGGYKAIRLDAFEVSPWAVAFYPSCGFSERGRTIYRVARLVYFEHLLTD